MSYRKYINLLSKQRYISSRTSIRNSKGPLLNRISSFSTHDNVAHQQYKHGNGGEHSEDEHDKTRKRYSSTVLQSVVILGCGFAVSYAAYSKFGFGTLAECKQAKESAPIAGKRKNNLPDIRQADIRAHNSREKGIWVTFDEGVYDITEFVEGHPGGKEKILLASGGQLEPFWDMYAVHKNASVYEILEELRIGNVHPEDRIAMTSLRKNATDPFANDPSRHPALQVNSEKPFNAETPPQLLTDTFLTPNELFFVRNHLPVPDVNASKFKLEVQAENKKKALNLSVGELKKKFKPHTITATIQCAGNRRTHMACFKPVKGLSWGAAAISNAEWTGVLLVDVLQQAGISEDDYKHIIFQGLDKDLQGSYYEASIPIETAMDPKREVLLAYSMNGKDIPLDHGYPLRVVVPGTVGARQVKWLNKIVASKEESKSHWQQMDYKTFTPSTEMHQADFSKAVPIQDYPLQSGICYPQDGDTLEDSEEVTVKGYAWSGGGRGIIRVEVSADGGKTWHEARLHVAEQKLHRQWAWTLYDVTIPLSAGQSEVELICKAIDSSHNQQPESAEGIWNMRGLIHNAWHRVKVKVPKPE